MNVPPEALKPLRERLITLMTHQQREPDPKRATAIGELDALIKRLETQNVPTRRNT